MKKWKEELIKAKEDVVFVKYNRGEGATETILKKILNSTDKATLEVLYVGTGLMSVIDRLEESDKNIKTERISRRLVKIRYGEVDIKITLTTGNGNDNYLNDIVRGIRFDLGIYDAMSFSIPKPLLLNCKKVIAMFPVEDWKSVKFIESNEEKLVDNKTLLQEEISRLYRELSQMDHNEKTTMTRERLINMIEKLEDLNKNHYSYVNKGDNFMSTGIGKDSSEGSVITKTDEIVMKVANKEEVFEEAKKRLLPNVSKYVDEMISYVGGTCVLYFKRHKYDKFKLENGELIKGQEIVFRDKICKIVEIPGCMGFEFEIKVELVGE